MNMMKIFYFVVLCLSISAEDFPKFYAYSETCPWKPGALGMNHHKLLSLKISYYHFFKIIKSEFYFRFRLILFWLSPTSE